LARPRRFVLPSLASTSSKQPTCPATPFASCLSEAVTRSTRRPRCFRRGGARERPGCTGGWRDQRLPARRSAPSGRLGRVSTRPARQRDTADSASAIGPTIPKQIRLNQSAVQVNTEWNDLFGSVTAGGDIVRNPTPAEGSRAAPQLTSRSCSKSLRQMQKNIVTRPVFIFALVFAWFLLLPAHDGPTDPR